MHGDQAGPHRPVVIDAIRQAGSKGDPGQLGGLHIATPLPPLAIIDPQTVAAEEPEAGDPLIIDGVGQIEAAERGALQGIAAVVAPLLQIQLEVAVYSAAIDLQLGACQPGHAGRIAGDGLRPLGAGGRPCVGQGTVGRAGFIQGKAAGHGRGTQQGCKHQRQPSLLHIVTPEQ